MSALRDRRIVVTRAAHQAAGLASMLEEAGAEPVLCPTIGVSAPDSWAGLDAALARLGAYRWIVFTSSNGVRAVASRLAASSRSLEELDGQRVAAVGSSTARALLEHGLRPTFVPDVERSRALAESLPDVGGEEILLPRADIADPAMVETFRGRGAARIDDVVAYRTLLLEPSEIALRELRRGVDGITFTSPSTVRGFLGIGPECRDFLDGVVVATLGPAATDVARENGVDVTVESRERSMSGLVGALREAFESRRRADEES